MGKKSDTARTCSDCFHNEACHLWCNSISDSVSPKCPQFEPVRYVKLRDLHDMHIMLHKMTEKED